MGIVFCLQDTPSAQGRPPRDLPPTGCARHWPYPEPSLLALASAAAARRHAGHVPGLLVRLQTCVVRLLAHLLHFQAAAFFTVGSSCWGCSPCSELAAQSKSCISCGNLAAREVHAHGVRPAHTGQALSLSTRTSTLACQS